ncbi:hypothetical protein EHQ61_00020 [Leptospira wolffii]|uniref:hypothetical protein n=1 Tax=Leptospira wolffii TaxID=409998 RepID=UPI001084387B|nr:hypothetical protein [Leptospira wolffii]TGL55682.1 hypothetical protein EHQ61_00020 [Leptospira wolffii]
MTGSEGIGMQKLILSIFKVVIVFGIFGCLPYQKKRTLLSQTEVSRNADFDSKSEYSIEYKFIESGLQFSFSENKTNFDKIVYEKNYNVERTGADFNSDVCGEGKNYSKCLVEGPFTILGVGILFTLPIIIYDWATYPIYRLKTYDETKKEVERSPKKSIKVENTPAAVTLVNKSLNFAKRYIFKNGKVTVPISDLDMFKLTKSAEVQHYWNDRPVYKSENSSYFYFVTDLQNNNLIPSAWIEGEKIYSASVYRKINDSWMKKKEADCKASFDYSILRESINHISDQGLYDNELVAQGLVNSACKKYDGTDSYSPCVYKFSSCIPIIRRSLNDQFSNNK